MTTDDMPADAQMIMMPEKLILSDELSALLIKGFSFGATSAPDEPFALVEVSGRINHSTERQTASFALQAEGVIYLIDGLLNILSTMSEMKKRG